jgi:tetratricopeptide (TPR) repeat protein
MDTTAKFQTAVEHYQKGNLHEAENICREILLIQPKNIDVLRFLAMLFYQSQKYNLSTKYIQKVLELVPNDFFAFFLLGNIFHEQGNLAEAITSFQQATLFNSSFADAYYNLGIVLEKKDELEKAITSYKRALDLNPDLADVYNNLGNALYKKSHLDEAIPYLIKSLELNPEYILAFNNLGMIYKSKKEFDKAISSFHKVIELNPSSADAYYNLAVVLKEQNQSDEAFALLHKAIELNPSFADAYNNLALISEENGQIEESLAYYRKALSIKPDDAEIHWNISLTFLSSGNFEQGWKEYEWRLQVEDFKHNTFSQPQWDGRPLHEKTIIVAAEQGVGDEIMFASCLPELIAKSGLCIIECNKRLIPLFSRSFPKALVIGRLDIGAPYPEHLPPAEMRISMGSLPKFFRPNLSSFPQLNAYLITDDKKVELWRKRFFQLGSGLKIGISWRGGSKPAEKLAKSTVLEQWKNLFSVAGVHFINLQYGDCTNELREAREKTGILIHDWEDADPLTDLDGFAAQITALDLVISVDNATVHMAGALGVPVWVLLPFSCDWRWMRDVDDTPWYKSVRLIRQKIQGDWDEVFKRTASELSHYLATGTLPEITHSYKNSLSNEPASPLFLHKTDRTYRCAVITPVGPGHESLYRECLASVEKAFNETPVNCAGILPIRIDDTDGRLGRSKARNLGVHNAAEQGAEWIFFLDADDLMSPLAFEYVSPYLESYDGIWGSIWSIEKGELAARERPKQLPFLYSIEDVLFCDPFFSLQMGHFIKTQAALATLFDESIDTGEDFDYYLRVWEKYRCIKIPLPFFYNRRGLHSHGPRSATGFEWRQQVENIMKLHLSNIKRKNE